MLLPSTEVDMCHRKRLHKYFGCFANLDRICYISDFTSGVCLFHWPHKRVEQRNK